MNNVMEYLKQHNKNEAKNLEKSMNVTNNILGDLLKDLNDKAVEFQNKQKYDKILEIVKIQKDLSEMQEQFRLNMINDKTKRIKKKNNNNLTLDKKTSHSINEDFRFTKPYAFELNGELIKVSSWRELLIKTSEKLNKINPEIFQTFLTDKSMFWGNKANFVLNKEDVRNGVLINDSNIYIETSKNSMASIQIIKKMLSKYEINHDNYKVYLRANYKN